jgi:glyceraldehyde-3-phosphate dehydrogenase (NADP+)
MNNHTILVPSSFDQLFPAADAIPEEAKLKMPVRQTSWLVNGELREWKGPFSKVVSPIYVRGAKGLEPVEVGSHPLLSKEAALEALEAAYNAYALGRGFVAEPDC